MLGCESVERLEGESRELVGVVGSQCFTEVLVDSVQHGAAAVQKGVAGGGDVEVGGAAAARGGEAFDGADLLQLEEGGLHALGGDAVAAGQFTVGEAGLVGEMAERGEVTHRQSLQAQFRLGPLTQLAAEHHQQERGADRWLTGLFHRHIIAARSRFQLG